MLRPSHDDHDIDLIERFIADTKMYLMCMKQDSERLSLGLTGAFTLEQLRLIENIQQATDTLQELCTQILHETQKTGSDENV